MQITATGSQPISDVQPLLDALTNLSGWRGRQRKLAAWVLGQIPLTEEQRQTCLAALLPLAEHHVEQGSTRRKMGRWFLRAMMVSILLLIRVFISLGIGFRDIACLELLWAAFFIFVGALLSLILIPITLPLSLLLDDRRMARLRPVVTAVGHLRLPESISTLAAAASHSALRPEAVSALRQALLTITPAHFGQLPGQTVPNLCAALDYADEELTAVILRALEMIGDGRAVRRVQRLAELGVTLAQEILPVLLARQAQENQSAFLLRAASAGSAASGDLLRPPREISGAAPEELLRASQSKDGSQ